MKVFVLFAMITVIFFNFSAHAKIKDHIYINNGVAFNLDSYEKDSMESLEAKLFKPP